MGVSHEWLNCYWVLRWQVLLSLAFVLVLCSKSALAVYYYGNSFDLYDIKTDCNPAAVKLIERKNSISQHLESFDCKNISISPNYCYRDGTETPDSDCSALYFTFHAVADKDIPNSCMGTGYPNPYQGMDMFGFSAGVFYADCTAVDFPPSTPTGGSCEDIPTEWGYSIHRCTCPPDTGLGQFLDSASCVPSLYTTIFLISGFQQQGDIAICLSD